MVRLWKDGSSFFHNAVCGVAVLSFCVVCRLVKGFYFKLQILPMNNCQGSNPKRSPSNFCSRLSTSNHEVRLSRGFASKLGIWRPTRQKTHARTKTTDNSLNHRIAIVVSQLKQHTPVSQKNIETQQ
jgi:hypothetical protein